VYSIIRITVTVAKSPDADVHDYEGTRKKRANRYRIKFGAGSVSDHNRSKLRSTTKIPLTEWSSQERHFPGWTPFSTAGFQLIS
jgi:hypothetical protein